ncbi:MAG TPA: TolC family protein [Bryobacteraceae bacterium]|nr:TolC family protein [Bryobacteraceae bacterium]
MKKGYLVLPLLLAATAVAQDTPRVGVLGEAKITVDEVIERVLTSDTELAVSRIAKEEAVLNLKAAQGVFDPRLGFTGHQSRAISPVSSSLGGATNGKLTNKEFLADPSLNGLSPILGGSYKLDFSNSRQSTDSTFATLNPQFLTSLSLNLNQPLVRGLFYDDNRHRIQVAKKNIDLSSEQFRLRVIEIVTRAVQAWWEVEFAYRNLDVQKEAVRLAERQDASNRRLLEQGLLAPVDVVQTQTLIATFQQNVFLAENALTAAENGLKVLMLPDRNDLMWGMALVPQRATDTPGETPSLQAAVKQALDARPELRESGIAVEMNQMDVRLANEQRKPQVDAFATVSANGLAGSQVVSSGPNPFTAAFGPLIGQINQLSTLAGIPQLPPISFGSGGVPPVFIGGYGQSLSALGTGHFTTAVAGINFSLPLRNRTANAQAEFSIAEQRRLTTQKRQVEMAIEQDVRNALQAVASNRARLEAARNATRNADEQYQSETRQFQAGNSTVFLVLQRQTDLVAARTREVRAEADAGVSDANLDRALARTIEVRRIQVR